jgi:excisionase family DNA binding protein
MQRTTATREHTTTDPVSAPGNREERRHPEALHDYESAAPVLRCSARMVRKLVETRQLASVKVGTLVRIEPEAISDYIERNRRDAS